MHKEPFTIRIIHQKSKKDKEARDKTFVRPPTFEQVVEVVEQVRSRDTVCIIITYECHLALMAVGHSITGLQPVDQRCPG